MPRSKNNNNKGAAAVAADPAIASMAQPNTPPSEASPVNNGQGQQQGGGKKNRSDDHCVFVGNMAFTTTWQKLKDVMRKAGDVHLVELIVDSSHKPKGSALITFGSEQDAKTAVATLNGTMVDGREILVRAYEKGARPLVIYGNYTREQLNRVLPKQPAGQGAPGGHQQQQQQQAPHHQHQQQQQHQPHHHQQQRGNDVLPGGDRMSLRGQQGHGGPQEWSVHDGGDFNRRNKDTFGDEATAYKPHGNGMPSVPLPASQAGVDRKKLFVSNLPFTCTWKLLKDTFAQVGNVLRADIIMDERGRSRGMGTVVFASTKDALKAIEEFDGIEMDGRPMGVRLDRDFLAPHQ